MKKLINTIYKNIDFIEFLYERRDLITYIDKIENYNPNYVQLEELDIISINENIIELNYNILDFFSSYYDNLTTDSIYTIDGLIDKIKKDIELLKLENSNSKLYINKITKKIYQLNIDIKSNLNGIKKDLENIKIFKSFQEKQKQIDFLYERVEDWKKAIEKINLFLNNSFFNSLYDFKLKKTIKETLKSINEYEKTLYPIYNELNDYINKYKIKSEINSKIFNLKQLIKDNKIKEATNIKKILKTYNIIEIPIKTIKTLNQDYIKLEDDLKDIDNIKLLNKINNKKINKRKKENIIIEEYNLLNLNNAFLLTSFNLIEFLLNEKIKKDNLIKVYSDLLFNYSDKYKMLDEEVVVYNIKFKKILRKD